MRDKKKMIHYDTCREEDIRSDDEVHDFSKRTRTWNVSTMARAKD